jgi:hypothetical protein
MKPNIPTILYIHYPATYKDTILYIHDPVTYNDVVSTHVFIIHVGAYNDLVTTHMLKLVINNDIVIKHMPSTYNDLVTINISIPSFVEKSSETSVQKLECKHSQASIIMASRATSFNIAYDVYVCTDGHYSFTYLIGLIKPSEHVL